MQRQNYLEQKVQKVMNSGGTRPFRTFFGAALFFISQIYGVAVVLRAMLYRNSFLKKKKLPCKVVSIGNLTVGGTGKTPLAIYVAHFLKQHGYNVAVASRGYMGDNENTGGVVSDGNKIWMAPREAGDEAYLMACKLEGVPVLVGKKRFESGLRAVQKFGTEVLVLDDGFQHMPLHRDIDLALFDAHQPVGNGYLVPRGTLREPVKHVERAHAFVMTRCLPGQEGFLGEALESRREGRPGFFCTHVPDVLIGGSGREGSLPFFASEALSLDTVKGNKVLAFSGIGNNEVFLNTVEGLGCDVAAFLRFADHHRYSKKDVERIQAMAEDLDVDCILTTEKDLVRFESVPWRTKLYAVGIRVAFSDGGKAFEDFLVKMLTLRSH